ncbi:transcriptional regulator, partial [Candidatus Entotheonella serta]
MILQFGNCTLDTVRDEIRRSGTIIHTWPQALVVLRYLLEHRDRVVSRDELFEQCWPESTVSDATLTSCLRRVRQTIGQNRTSPVMIETLHRHGYRFVAEVTELAETTLGVSDM